MYTASAGFSMSMSRQQQRRWKRTTCIYVVSEAVRSASYDACRATKL